MERVCANDLIGLHPSPWIWTRTGVVATKRQLLQRGFSDSACAVSILDNTSLHQFSPLQEGITSDFPSLRNTLVCTTWWEWIGIVRVNPGKIAPGKWWRVTLHAEWRSCLQFIWRGHLRCKPGYSVRLVGNFAENECWGCPFGEPND